MATSSKKITYTSDFKLKVLDYYFKNGGDEKFGLKKKTAGHFNIDKKTINRMLNNPEMVKRARKLLSKRVTGSAKGAAGSRAGGAKATAKGTKVSGLGSKAGCSKAGTAGNKLGTASTSSKVTSSSHISASDTSSSSSYKAPTSSALSTKHVGGNNNSQGSSTSTQTSTKSNSSKIKYMGQDINSGVQVFDLPEDPDYSLLKRSINASANGVANIARLLVTGTEEVRNIILNECDMILECKVCHNLFRSVVNFLAHKRIYCQEEFADVRTLFHKDDVQGITSHSSTVIVEPEPPPDKDPHPSTSSAPEPTTKPSRTAMQGNSSRSGIDSIAAKLANRKKHSNASHASHTGSSRFFERLDCVNSIRDKLSRDCSVVLEDIAGVTNARYQTFVSPAISAPTVSMNTIVDEVSKCSTGLTVAINEHGEIMKTAPGNVRTMDVEQPIACSGISKELVCRMCNTRFATQKTLSVHQRSHHGFERCIYCCPICKSTFLSMWAVVKHLQRYHKKTKNQTERLRKVIKKNVFKKMVFHSEDRHGEYREMDIFRKEEEIIEKENQNVGKEGTTLEENSTNNQSTKREVQGLPRSSVLTSPRKCSPTKSPLKRDDISSGCSPEHRCVKCDRRFMTATALISHDKFCSLLQMRPDILPENPLNPRLRSETPEKKIAIQIRKDYKKTMIPQNPNIPNHHEENKQNKISFKVPEIPKEQEKENHRKIEMMMSEFCNMTRLACIPCEKRYQTITTLKRHASQHFNWTRYACRLCKFRSYHRYETIRHCIGDHKANEHSVGNMIMDDESFGPLRYFLTSEDDTSVSSDADDPESHGSHSRSTSESCNKIFTGHLNDTQNSKENDEGVENIRPPPLEKFESESNAKENISNELTVLSAKDMKEETTDMVKVGETSCDTKIQSIEDNERVPETSDTSKSISPGKSIDIKPNLPSNMKSVSKNAINHSDSNISKALTSGSQNLSKCNSEQSCKDTLELDKRELTQTSGASSETCLSIPDKNNENSNTFSDSKSIKGNQGILKQYPLRGQVDSMGHGNQISDDADEARSERPQRLRRSVEQKDFIYDIKRSGFQKLETESSKRNSTPKKGMEHKSDDRPVTRRRNTFPRSDMPAKKIKITDVCSTLEGCNGTTSQLQNKKVLPHSGFISKGKGRNSQLAATRGKDTNSSQQHPQTKEPIKLVMQGKSDDTIVSEKLGDSELLYTCKSESSHNSIEQVSQIKGADTEKLDFEGIGECKPNFVSEKIENISLELGCQKKLEDTFILERETKEDCQINPYIFENGKVQTDGDNDKDEADQKSGEINQIDNGGDPVWEKGKGENTINDINPKEQEAVL